MKIAIGTSSTFAAMVDSAVTMGMKYADARKAAKNAIETMSPDQRIQWEIVSMDRPEAIECCNGHFSLMHIGA